jgi:hypothetical protein
MYNRLFESITPPNGLIEFMEKGVSLDIAIKREWKKINYAESFGNYT